MSSRYAALLRKKTFWYGLASLLVIAAIAGALWPDKSAGTDPRTPVTGARSAPAVPVLVASVERRLLNIVQTGLGTVMPAASVEVRARVAGQLQQVLFEEGQEVQQGQLLARIDNRPFTAALEQVKGQLERNRALLANARRDLQRYQALHQQQSLSQQQIDAQSSLVAQYQGTVNADEGALAQAQLQVEFTRITAPISGRIGLRQVDAGNNITPGDSAPLAIITALEEVHVVFSIPEDDAPRLLAQYTDARQRQQSLPVEAWDRSQRERLAEGRLLAVDNRIDSRTGTLKLKALFDNRNQRLLAQQFVNVRVQVETRPDALLVPATAVQRGSQGDFVYVVKTNDDQGQAVSLRAVQTGAREAEQVAIERGLEEGELVVINGVDRLREGAIVRVANRQPAAKPAATTPLAAH